ncbi:hypothetical protein [Spirosoma agri]|uniref:Uncharacterized protein n=1 Tax=Spirosoma agri TaxID=1987381 RepID=A0A6M0IR38_9BACT|nr:hypothetical protein [Spirosoma agri]NEU70779.1 hypothetical protein [Spirosoma agri]
MVTLLLFLAGLIRVVAQTPTAVSGRVLDYLANRIGDYDGLRLQTAAGEVYLFFPPHAAAQIRRLAATGQRIKADVEPGHGGPGHAKPVLEKSAGGVSTAEPATIPTYRLIRLRNATSGTLLQLSDLPPPPPQPGVLVQTEGPLVAKMIDDHGDLIALLTDKYLIELKPHQSEQISSLLVGVQRLGAVGFERNLDGFVNRSGRPVLHPTALTIRGQTFAL